MPSSFAYFFVFSSFRRSNLQLMHQTPPSPSYLPLGGVDVHEGGVIRGDAAVRLHQEGRGLLLRPDRRAEVEHLVLDDVPGVGGMGWSVVEGLKDF